MRTCFQRDRDRIIHSSSFRRLEYKTQVFVNHEGDNYRTRLTHSLEGAQIGRTVARALGLNEELTECLVLGHDLGHTPFGHSGERVMNELMREHGGFEHNRQTLRILEVLERRYPDFPGLNLTWEVREGIIKHRPDTRRDRARRSTRRARRRPSRPSSSTSWTRSPTTTTTSTTGSRSGMFTVEQIREVAALPRGARRRAAPGLRRTSGSRGTTWSAGSSTAACATSSRRRRRALEAGARRSRSTDVRAGGTAARRLLAGDGGARARAEGLPVPQHVPALPGGADGRQGRAPAARPVRVLRERAAAAARRTTRSSSSATASTASSATTSRA